MGVIHLFFRVFVFIDAQVLYGPILAITVAILGAYVPYECYIHIADDPLFHHYLFDVIDCMSDVISLNHKE